MFVSIVIGSILGFALFYFNISIFKDIFQSLANLAINSLLYLSIIYTFTKGILGFLNLKKEKRLGRISLNFFVMAAISVFFSILISIIIMNISFFQPNNHFNQKGDKIIHLNSIGILLEKILSKNIINAFVDSQIFILPVIFIALIISTAAFYVGKKSLYFIDMIDSFDAILDKIVHQILEIFSIFSIFICFVFINKETFSSENLSFIFKPLLAIITAAIIQIAAYYVFLYLNIKKDIKNFTFGILGAAFMSLVTGNTAASIIPLTEHLKRNIGVKKEIAETLGPLGMILNKSGTIVVSTVVLMSLILIYSTNMLEFRLQVIFLFLLFIFSFFIDGANDKGFIVIIFMILSIKQLHLEEDSYLLFISLIPILSRIGVFIDTFSNAVLIAVVSKKYESLELKKYLDFI
jgi:Na+/H+-dicarboxylate symporter